MAAAAGGVLGVSVAAGGVFGVLVAVGVGVFGVLLVVVVAVVVKVVTFVVGVLSSGGRRLVSIRGKSLANSNRCIQILYLFRRGCHQLTTAVMLTLT